MLLSESLGIPLWCTAIIDPRQVITIKEYLLTLAFRQLRSYSVVW